MTAAHLRLGIPGTIYSEVFPGESTSGMADRHIGYAVTTRESPARLLTAADLQNLIGSELRRVDTLALRLSGSANGVVAVGLSGSVVEVFTVATGRVVAGVANMPVGLTSSGKPEGHAVSAGCSGANGFTTGAALPPGEQAVALKMSRTGPLMTAGG